MDKKIKISLPKETLELLKKDCDDFNIVKTNGEPNFNHFINLLINNFYGEFTASEESLNSEIRNILSPVPSYCKEEVFADILKLFAKQNYSIADKHNSTTFSFKPTKVADKAVVFINQVLNKDDSISSFYRRMFIDYSKSTKNEREKIIHKENYEILQKAIKKELQVCITLNSNEIFKNASVFAISASKDELFNYVLVCVGKLNFTLRLASIYSVSILSDKAGILPENQKLFEKQLACAVQYPILATDNNEIEVQLTDKGKKLFKKIYLYRPVPIKIDGDIYTFDCSATQIIYYFKRFGDDALILSPYDLGIHMRNYYYFALKKYRTLYKFDKKQ